MNCYSFDATFCKNRLGKCVNHSRLHFNCKPVLVGNEDNKRICLFAIHDMPPGTELRYNYEVTGLKQFKVGSFCG